MQAFSDRAYDEVSIDDLAKVAGISKGLLYHYFPTKRDFYVAGLREAARQLMELVFAVPPDASPIDKLRHSIDTYLDYVLQHARAYRSLLRGGLGADPEVAAVVEEVRTTFFERLLSDQSSPVAGSARELPVVRTAMRGWIGYVEAATLEWADKQDVDRRRFRDLLVDMAVMSFKLAMGEQISREW